MRILLTILLLLCASPLWGATYTVCSSGCDETAIQDVFDNNDLAPGDIVEVHAGTYAELVTWGTNDSGDSGDDVTLQARSGDTVTIDAEDTRASCIDLNNQDYITIDGITMIDGTSFGLDSYGSGSVYITVQNCTFSGNDTGAISLTGSTINNWTINNNTITSPSEGIGIDVMSGPDTISITDNTISGGGWGIRVGNNNATDVSSGITITGNTIDDFGNSAGVTHAVQVYVYSNTSDTYVISNNTASNPANNYDAFELAWNGAPTSVTISNNTVTNDTPSTGDYGIVVDMLAGGVATVSANRVSDVPSGGIYIMGGTGSTITRNYIYNCGGSASADFPGIQVKSKNWATAVDAPDAVASNHVVSYNIIEDCSRGIGVAVENGLTANGIKFYNNTISGTDASGTGVNLGSIYAYDTDGTMDGVEIKNNIVNDGGADYFVYISADCASNLDVDYNLYYAPSFAGINKWVHGASATDTLATWNGYAGVGDDTEGDPLLTNSLALDVGSPAIDAGTDVGLTSDYHGGKVPRGSGYDIGAKERSPNAIIDTLRSILAGIGISL